MTTETLPLLVEHTNSQEFIEGTNKKSKQTDSCVISILFHVFLVFTALSLVAFIRVVTHKSWFIDHSQERILRFNNQSVTVYPYTPKSQESLIATHQSTYKVDIEDYFMLDINWNMTFSFKKYKFDIHYFDLPLYYDSNGNRLIPELNSGRTLQYFLADNAEPNVAYVYRYSNIARDGKQFNHLSLQKIHMIPGEWISVNTLNFIDQSLLDEISTIVRSVYDPASESVPIIFAERVISGVIHGRSLYLVVFIEAYYYYMYPVVNLKPAVTPVQYIFKIDLDTFKIAGKSIYNTQINRELSLNSFITHIYTSSEKLFVLTLEKTILEIDTNTLTMLNEWRCEGGDVLKSCRIQSVIKATGNIVQFALSDDDGECWVTELIMDDGSYRIQQEYHIHHKCSTTTKIDFVDHNDHLYISHSDSSTVWKYYKSNPSVSRIAKLPNIGSFVAISLSGQYIRVVTDQMKFVQMRVDNLYPRFYHSPNTTISTEMMVYGCQFDLSMFDFYSFYPNIQGKNIWYIRNNWLYNTIPDLYDLTRDSIRLPLNCDETMPYNFSMVLVQVCPSGMTLQNNHCITNSVPLRASLMIASISISAVGVLLFALLTMFLIVFYRQRVLFAYIYTYRFIKENTLHINFLAIQHAGQAPPRPFGKKFYPKKHAVVVAIDDYGNPKKSLGFCIKSADNLQKELKDHEFEVHTLYNSEAIKDNIFKAIADTNAGVHDLFFFYFSGHGKNGVLELFNNNKSRDLSYIELIPELLKVKSQHKLIVIDACAVSSIEDFLDQYWLRIVPRSKPARTSDKSVKPESWQQEPVSSEATRLCDGKNEIVIYATCPDKKSYGSINDGSYLTEAFLRVLRDGIPKKRYLDIQDILSKTKDELERQKNMTTLDIDMRNNQITNEGKIIFRNVYGSKK
jgi:hypothetical protein